MAVIVIRQTVKARWLPGLRAAVYRLARRAMACAAAVVMVGAVGAALLQLTAEILSFPAPVAAIAMTAMAAALLNSLRRYLRGRPDHRSCHRPVGHRGRVT